MRLNMWKVIQRYSLWRKGVVVWYPCNIYRTARIGREVNIGMYSEIGPDTVVGDYTRIGMGTFIAARTIIGKGCFIGPKCCFVHDMYPPMPRDRWQAIHVLDGASIGANVLIRPGVTIGRNALVGLGSVVTRDVGEGEVWFGNPARKERMRTESEIGGSYGWFFGNERNGRLGG